MYSLNRLICTIALLFAVAVTYAQEQQTGTNTVLEKVEVPESDTDNVLYSQREVDVPPKFPGGQDALVSEIIKGVNAATTAAPLKGRATLSFTVEKDGNISKITYMRESDKAFAEEAVKALRKIPKKWTAGVLNGKAVRTLVLVPVTIL